jgi:hypothetical protein
MKYLPFLSLLLIIAIILTSCSVKRATYQAQYKVVKIDTVKSGVMIHFRRVTDPEPLKPGKLSAGELVPLYVLKRVKE